MISGLLLTLILISVILYLYIFTFPAKDTPQSLKQAQAELVSYADQNQLKNKEIVYRGAATLCSSSNGLDSDCTLSSTYVYKLEGNFRDNGKEILSYLKNRGFDFKSTSKYKHSVPKKLNDISIADNMTNSTPIIVDLYNDETDTRVRVSLGDRGRTSPMRGPATGQPLDQIASDQLIARLQFYRP